MISDAFRAYTEMTRALSTDAEGSEVLVGLSVEETRDYLQTLDRKLDDSGESERFSALHEKHELARLAVIGAEIDLSGFVREPGAYAPQSQKDAFQMPPDRSRR